MADDIITELGFLCLGSRFKRLGERLQGDVARFLAEVGLDVQPAQYPILVVLEEGPATIGRLVERVGVSQPGITRSIARLIEMGLVEPLSRQRDQRFRAVQLTARGRDLVSLSRRDVFPRIEAAVDQICGALNGSLLDQLGAIERALGEASIDQRALRMVPGE